MTSHILVFPVPIPSNTVFPHNSIVIIFNCVLIILVDSRACNCHVTRVEVRRKPIRGSFLPSIFLWSSGIDSGYEVCQERALLPSEALLAWVWTIHSITQIYNITCNPNKGFIVLIPMFACMNADTWVPGTKMALERQPQALIFTFSHVGNSVPLSFVSVCNRLSGPQMLRVSLPWPPNLL